jgi:hypothetical protein
LENVKHWKKIGIEKSKNLKKDFDRIYDKYRKKSNKCGLFGDLKFKTEHGNVIIYAEIKDILD